MIGRDSRYVSAILFRDRNIEILGARTLLDSSPRSDDRTHIVVEGDRLDLLAERYFGRADLWWVIADYNEITWPLDLESGATLRIPSRVRIALL